MARKIARKMVHEWGMGETRYFEAENAFPTNTWKLMHPDITRPVIPAALMK